jgi:GNAT superfamily N-acetyltransferase
MPFRTATPEDIPEVIALVNSAYRGESSRRGWTTEADYIDGQRIDEAMLRQDLAAQPAARLLLSREAAGGPLLGCVWLEPAEPGVTYLGMLTVRPDLQAGGVGRRLLEAAEAVARAAGAARVRITVVQVRDALIAWYRRRGYAETGETRPFPYGDPRFGEPLRDDLYFIVMEKGLA